MARPRTLRSASGNFAHNSGNYLGSENSELPGVVLLGCKQSRKSKTEKKGLPGKPDRLMPMNWLAHDWKLSLELVGGCSFKLQYYGSANSAAALLELFQELKDLTPQSNVDSIPRVVRTLDLPPRVHCAKAVLGGKHPVSGTTETTFVCLRDAWYHP